MAAEREVRPPRQQRPGDGPRLVAHVEASERGRTTSASNSARVSGQPWRAAWSRKPIAAYPRTIASAGRPRRAVPRDALAGRARRPASVDATQRWASASKALYAGRSPSAEPRTGTWRGVDGAHRGIRELVVAESDGVDVVEGAEQAVERALAEAAVPGDAARDPRVGELQQDRGTAAEQQHALRAVAAEHLAFVLVDHQYQLYAISTSWLPPSGPTRRTGIRSARRCSPGPSRSAWRRSCASRRRHSAILLPGSDCGMP